MLEIHRRITMLEMDRTLAMLEIAAGITMLEMDRTLAMLEIQQDNSTQP